MTTVLDSFAHATLAIVALALSLACCTSEASVLSVEITLGHETEALSRDPAVTRVDVVAKAPEGDLTLTASAEPGGTFDLGEVESDRLLTFEVTGLDAAGKSVVRGRSLGVVVGAIASEVIPVFVSRVGTWARPPGESVRAHLDAKAGVLAERYLFTTGGTRAVSKDGDVAASEADYYDLLSYSGAVSETFDRAAQSIVVVGDRALLVDATGATWVDFSTGLTSEASVPSGLASFAEISGGTTTDAADGVAFVVGATRKGDATSAVLHVAADGTLSARKLAHARKGAAAAWIPDVGLAVMGGSDAGSGGELLAAGATSFTELELPSDPTEGAALLAMANGELTLVGGQVDGKAAKARRFELPCANPCKLTAIEGLTIDSLFSGARAFAMDAARGVVVGQDSDGTTRSFVLDLTSDTAEEIAFRESRRGAVAVAAPNGTLAVLGGLRPDDTPALTIEVFFPE